MELRNRELMEKEVGSIFLRDMVDPRSYGSVVDRSRA